MRVKENKTNSSYLKLFQFYNYLLLQENHSPTKDKLTMLLSFFQNISVFYICFFTYLKFQIKEKELLEIEMPFFLEFAHEIFSWFTFV